MNDFSLMVPREIENSEWRWVFISSILLLIVITLPFIIAYGLAGPDKLFMGMLINPIDGLSYLAKMQQGVDGSWLFHLPSTPDAHAGVFLFTFYLSLGHLASLLNLPPITIFHVMRIIGAMMMFFALYRFVADWTSSVEQRRITWSLAVLGSGFGWLAIAFGHVSPDVLLIPEAFPLQAAYANPHFPWAIAAALVAAHVLVVKCLMEDDVYPAPDIETLGLVAATVLLATTSPFILLPIGIGFGAMLIWLMWQRRELPLRELAWGSVVLIFGLPFIIYGFVATSAQNNPIFATWMAQNATPSPTIWDYLIAFAPLLLMAGIAIASLRRVFQSGDVFLLGWLVSGIILLYIPINLQRRFVMGLIVPLSIYAGRGLWRVIAPKFGRRRGLAVALSFALFMPTTIVAIVAPLVNGLNLAESDGGLYFVNNSEIEAFQWLGRHAHDSLVLASPNVGALLPVYGVRVVYGHPYETVRADERAEEVLDFYWGTDCSVLATEKVDYVLVGPRERALSDGDMCPVDGKIVYESTDSPEVVIYAVNSN